MKRDVPSDDGWAAPPERIELAVARIEHSAAFRGSPRHRALLRYLVTKLLDGGAAALKEAVIAVEVLGRPAASFDPKLDSIVRVETRRLRARLGNYYRGEGHDAPLRIELPVGSYVPLIAPRATPRGDASATRRARDLVERGEHFLRQATSKANLEQAIERFDAAQRESPTHAPACVGLARAWFNMAAGWYCDPRPAGEHAVEALRRALELDDANPNAWALLGAIQYQVEHDWPQAKRSLERAISLAPKEAFAHTAYGWQLTARGLLDDAERELALARRLDPQYINSRVHMINLRVAQSRLDDAQREVDAMRDIAPDSMVVAGMDGAIALFRREPLRAIPFYERTCALAPDHPLCPVLLAAAMAMAGLHERAEATLQAALDKFADRVISPYALAIYATRNGDHGRALSALDQALDERDPQAILFACDPSFEDLRGDPRWPALLGRLNLGQR